MPADPNAIETTDDGTPVIAGTNVPVQAMLDHFQQGGTMPQFIDAHPDVDTDTAVQVMTLALEAIDDPQTPSNTSSDGASGS